MTGWPLRLGLLFSSVAFGLFALRGYTQVALLEATGTRTVAGLSALALAVVALVPQELYRWRLGVSGMVFGFGLLRAAAWVLHGNYAQAALWVAATWCVGVLVSLAWTPTNGR